MSIELIIGLVSSLIGGALVATISHLSTRKRTEAEAKKLDAEAERIKVETTKMLSELNVQKVNPVSKSKAPTGWNISGSKPNEYEMGVDFKVAYSGKSSGYIKGTTSSTGFATLVQKFKADKFRGKRVRFSGFVKTEGVKEWANLWMRIDGAKNEGLGFDNMENRPIKDTRDWRKYSIVLDIPENSAFILIGIMLNGQGQVWADELLFETVKKTVSLTGEEEQVLAFPTEPINLDFEVE